LTVVVGPSIRPDPPGDLKALAVVPDAAGLDAAAPGGSGSPAAALSATRATRPRWLCSPIGFLATLSGTRAASRRHAAAGDLREPGEPVFGLTKWLADWLSDRLADRLTDWHDACGQSSVLPWQDALPLASTHVA
jgi:hypothetical protein